MWLQYEVRTDDITVIVLHLGSRTGGIFAREETADTDSTPATTVASVGTERTHSSINIAAALAVAQNRPVRRVMSREKKKLVILNNSNSGNDEEEEPINMAELTTLKSDEDVAAISNAMKNNFLFQHLNAAQRNTVIGVMQPVLVQAGLWVITQGDQGDRFYVVDSGRFEVRVQPAGSKLASGGDVVHVYESSKDLHPGFGELSLM